MIFNLLHMVAMAVNRSEVTSNDSGFVPLVALIACTFSLYCYLPITAVLFGAILFMLPLINTEYGEIAKLGVMLISNIAAGLAIAYYSSLAILVTTVFVWTNIVAIAIALLALYIAVPLYHSCVIDSSDDQSIPSGMMWTPNEAGYLVRPGKAVKDEAPVDEAGADIAPS